MPVAWAGEQVLALLAMPAARHAHHWPVAGVWALLTPHPHLRASLAGADALVEAPGRGDGRFEQRELAHTASREIGISANFANFDRYAVICAALRAGLVSSL